jgi:glycerophosphoryl diester phosphodiesterase
MLFLGFSCFHVSLAQTSYKIVRKLNTKELKLGDYGISVLSSSSSWSGKVVVEVTTARRIDRGMLCSVSDYPIVYKAWLTKNEARFGGEGGDRNGYIKQVRFREKCRHGKTNSVDYIRNMALFCNRELNGEGLFHPVSYSVNITLTLPKEVKLSDVHLIKIPGVEALYPIDFVKGKENIYNEDHDCANSNSGVCAELNKVRRISNLKKNDFVIQAHRGIWGMPDTNQENTIGAMKAAKDKGYKLLESDIMPIGVTNYDNPSNTLTFGKPHGLACFHDFVLTRYTNAASGRDSYGYIFNSDRDYLSSLLLKKPRSNTIGTEKIMFFDELVDYASQNDLIVCVDMKNLESKGQGDKCTILCEWQTQERKNMSLYNNLIFAINSLPLDKLKHIVIKTYSSYDDLKTALTTGRYSVSETRFNKVLWAPLIAGGSQWEMPSGEYDARRIQKFLDDWFAHNESVLYYETNFFNDYDKKTSVMLEEKFCVNNNCYNVMEYIYRMTGRRAGIFSEEPVGAKGTVNRWGDWKIKDPESDRRGDHLWLLKKPFFNQAVITTDRPDQWDVLKN